MVFETESDLKKRGISILDDIIEKQGGAIITVRGKNKYVVIDMNAYNQFKEYELEAALTETKRDLAEGNFVEGSVEDHIRRIHDEAYS